MEYRGDLEPTWVALDTALDGLTEWLTDDEKRRAFIPPKGDALVIEKDDSATELRVSLRQRKRDDLKERAAWIVQLDTGLNVTGIVDDHGKAVKRESVSALNDVLWRFHRLAAEDAASVHRS